MAIFQVSIVRWVLPTPTPVRLALTVTKSVWMPQQDPVQQDITAIEGLQTLIPPLALQGITAHLEPFFLCPALLEQ